jgi:hypothetical protein
MCYISCLGIHVYPMLPVSHSWLLFQFFCLNFLIALRKSKLNRAISVSQIMYSIQTAINPINFALLFSSGEWNTNYWRETVYINLKQRLTLR